MKTFTDPELINRLTWRYAVKQFDPAKKITASDWATLEQALVLSPSSYGLQPYRFLVINDAALRTRLAVASYGQSQIMDCSHLVVFAIRKGMDLDHIDHFIARVATVTKVTVESLAGYRKTIVGDLIDGPRHAWIDHWSARQAYMALGHLLTSAAALGIDACPMEGFNPALYDDILDLPERHLSATVVCALGYRSADDKHARDAKVRFAIEDLIEHW